MTPHDSRNLTNVKFLESALPQGESDYTELDEADCHECKANKKSKNSYSQKKLQFAKNLRHNQTDAEGWLLYYIRRTKEVIKILKQRLRN